MDLRRDGAFWNAIANDPAVRPFIGPGEQDLDLSPIVALELNYPLATEHGGFIFAKHEPGRYELHTIFGPQGRGRAVLDAFAEAARWMFTRTDCLEIVTKTAATNRPAAWMARLAGFRPLFVRKGAGWDGSDVTFYVLSLDEWMQRDGLTEGEGSAFHDLLEDAKRATGSGLPTHPDDPAHDRAAGAACLMAKAGQGAKAAWIDIELVSADPVIIDVRDALLGVRDGKLEVIECR